MLTIYALIPIAFLIVLLILFKQPAVIVGPITLLITIILAFSIWHHTPVLIFKAALEGIIYGLWPIGIIIFGSICLSNLMVASGSVKEIEHMVGTISNDTRIMVVLVAWGLESFLEAIAGFGSGLALPISILTVMGVSPLKAGIVALLANSIPTAYGGVGIAITALANISGIPISDLMQQISIQLFIPSLIFPFFITRVVTNSWKEVFEIFWVPFFAGLGQALGLMLPFSPAVVAIFSGLMNIFGSIVATLLFYPHLRISRKLEFTKVCKTLSSFLLAIFFILFTGPMMPSIYHFLSSIKTTYILYPGAKALVFRWISDTGVLLLVSGIIGGFIQGLKFSEITSILGKTALQLQKTLIVLISILAMARIMTYSGMIDSLSKGISIYLGDLYIVFAPVLGTIGVFVTGSVTSSAILMGALQAQMGEILQVSSSWLTAMNISGSTAGKMMAPHSVAIVMAAIGSYQEESKIMASIFKALLIYLGGLMILSLLGIYINIFI